LYLFKTTMHGLEKEVMKIGEWHGHNFQNLHLTVALSTCPWVVDVGSELRVLNALVTCFPQVDTCFCLEYCCVYRKYRFQTNELVLHTLVMNPAMSLLASTRFQHLSHLTVDFDADSKAPAKCLAKFVRHCPLLKKVTVKGCSNLPAQFQKRLFTLPVVRLSSRLIRFEFLN